MNKPYESPIVEFIQFSNQDTITTSSGNSEFGITKNPGHGCTIMPNGKPIPENAVGRYGEP